MLAETGDSLNFVGSLKVPDEVIIERIAGKSGHSGTPILKSRLTQTHCDRPIHSFVVRADLQRRCCPGYCLDHTFATVLTVPLQLHFNPPKVAGKDDVTGEPLSQRPDDDPVNSHPWQDGGDRC